MTTEYAACRRNCPIDWVACFKRDCPRATTIKRQQQERIDCFLRNDHG